MGNMFAMLLPWLQKRFPHFALLYACKKIAGYVFFFFISSGEQLVDFDLHSKHV